MVPLLPLLLAAMPAPFQIGETLAFEVRYLGVTAGEMTFAVQDEAGHPDRLRIRSEGRTLNAADSLFRLRTESFCVVERKRMLPLWCRSSYQSRSQDRRREIRYDRARRQVRETLLSDGESEKHVRDLGDDAGSMQEMLSAMYLTRGLDLRVGAPVTFTGQRGEKRIVVQLLPEAVEELATPVGPRPALRLAVSVKEKLEPDASDGGRYWVSADARRVPLRMEFDGPVGTVEMVLVRADNLMPGPVLTAER